MFMANAKEYMQKINQWIKSIESNIQRKAQQTTLEVLQKKVEDIENTIKSIGEGKQVGKLGTISWRL